MQIGSIANQGHLNLLAPTSSPSKTAKYDQQVEKPAEADRAAAAAPSISSLSAAMMAELNALRTEGQGIPVDQLTAINVADLERIQMPPEFMERMNNVMNGLFAKPNIPVDPPYAEVKVNGEVIAKVISSGGVETSNSMGSKIQRLFQNEYAEGPNLAEERLNKILEAFGGTVERASTAQTQAEWRNRPATTWSFNAETMAQHGFDVPRDLAHQRFATRELAQEAIAAFREQNQPT